MLRNWLSSPPKLPPTRTGKILGGSCHRGTAKRAGQKPYPRIPCRSDSGHGQRRLTTRGSEHPIARCDPRHRPILGRSRSPICAQGGDRRLALRAQSKSELSSVPQASCTPGRKQGTPTFSHLATATQPAASASRSRGSNPHCHVSDGS